MSDLAVRLLAINVGNTRTSFGMFEGKKPIFTRSVPNESFQAVVSAIVEASGELTDTEQSAIVLASVNPELAERLVETLTPLLPRDIYELGEDVPIPLKHTLDAEATTGQDRLLAAIAAFDAAQQACCVIDAGTAITVDFIDGVGVFHGGAILPGPRMMLRSLHEGTAQLPEVELARPDDAETFGKNTRQAMLNGVFYGVRGMVRLLIERYAESYGAYPQVIATGGDARLLFGDDELIEHIADDLVLRGIAIACEATLMGDEADAYEDERGEGA